MTTAMLSTTAPAASVPGHSVAFERAYTDRSNCRKAMLRWTDANGLIAEDFAITKHADRDFRFSRVEVAEILVATPAETAATPAPTEDGIPPFLKISPEQRRDAWAKQPPRAPRAPSQQETNDMAKKAAAKTAPATAGTRSRYDWNHAEQLAAAGKVPPKLDFSAPTHARFRDALDEVVKAAKAKNAKALAAIQINPISSSPKALDRYRNLCVKAVKAAA